MAVSGGGGGERGTERRPSEFIARLVRDPRNPPEVVEIVGYIGAAAEEGRTRVYLDTTLQNYVEIEEGKILHVEPVAEAQLGLSHVFVAADAQIFPPPERPPRLDARSVFGGAVYQDYLSAAGTGAAGLGGGAIGPVPPAPNMYQPSLLVVCATLTHWCQQTVSPDCRSLQLMVCHRPTRHEIQCTYHPLICFGAETPGGFGVGPYAAMTPFGEAAPHAQMAAQPNIQQAAAHLRSIVPVACPVTLPIWRCPPPPITVYPPWCPRTFQPWCPPATWQPWCRPTWQPWCRTLPPRCPTWQPWCLQRTLPGVCDVPVQSRAICPTFGPCPTIQCGGWDPGFDPAGHDVGGMMGGGMMGGGMMGGGMMGGGYAAGGGMYDPYAAYSTGF